MEDFNLKEFILNFSGFGLTFETYSMKSFGVFVCFILAIVRWDMNRFSRGNNFDRDSSIVF